MALILDLKVGESLKVGEAILTFHQKSGQRIKLEVSAPPTIEVKREPKK